MSDVTNKVLKCKQTVPGAGGGNNFSPGNANYSLKIDSAAFIRRPQRNLAGCYELGGSRHYGSRQSYRIVEEDRRFVANLIPAAQDHRAPKGSTIAYTSILEQRRHREVLASPQFQPVNQLPVDSRSTEPGCRLPHFAS